MLLAGSTTAAERRLSPVLLLPLLQPWSFRTSVNSCLNNEKTRWAPSGAGWWGCRSWHLALVRLLAAAAWVWKQLVSVFGTMLLHLSLPATESLFLELSGRGGDDKGERNHTQRVCTQTFLSFALGKCCIMFFKPQQQTVLVFMRSSQIFLEVRSPCWPWVSWRCGLPLTEKLPVDFLEDLLACEVQTLPGGKESTPTLSRASLVSANSRLQGQFVR